MREEEAGEQGSVADDVLHALVAAKLHSFLAVVAYHKRFAPVDGSALGLERSCQKVKEGGLAYAVPPDYAQFVAPLEIVAEVFKDNPAFPAVIHRFAIDHLVPQAGRPTYRAQIQGFGGKALGSPLLELVEGVDAVFCLAAAGAGSGAYPFQFTPQKVAHLVTAGVEIADSLVSFLEVVLVVSFIAVDASVVKLQDGVAHPVQEVPVVGDHQKGPAAFFELCLQVLHRVDVEMVGGLVQNQEIGIQGHHLAQGYPFDFTS